MCFAYSRAYALAPLARLLVLYVFTCSHILYACCRLISYMLTCLVSLFVFLFRGVFRTHLNIYDGVFLRKKLTAKSHYLFLQKSSIIDLRLGCKYASGIVKLNKSFIYIHFIFIGSNLKIYILKPI